ncbi:MAG: helix-turn-helix transcriptional regulator [Thermodesulfobacteriota bacterium]
MAQVPGDAHDAEDIPWEIAHVAPECGWSLVRSWREHLGLTQAEVAARMTPPISRTAHAQMEAPDARLRPGTINRIAADLGVNPAQLTD